jgi:hypothetical protein
MKPLGTWLERAAAVLVVAGLAWVLGLAVLDQWNRPAYQGPWGTVSPGDPPPQPPTRTTP